MENDIKAGDLVMVVRPRVCCGFTSGLGFTFVAGEIDSMPSLCNNCEKTTSMPSTLCGGYGANGLPFSVNLSRLIKIDPPAQPESTETRKEITA